MFGRDPRIPLTEALQPRLKYLGNDDVILSLEALKNMYLIVTENLRHVRETGWQQGPIKGLIMPNQLVTLKVHLHKTLAPRYEGNYRVVAFKGNQVEFAREGTVLPTKWYHVSHVKPLLQANEAINWLLHMTCLEARKNWLSILTTSLTLEQLSLDARSTSKASCEKGRGGRDRRRGRGWRRGRHWRCTGDEIKMIKGLIIIKKHKNFIKKMHKRRLRLSWMNHNQMPCICYGKM